MIQKSDPLNLIGKVAVITGAGSGIGAGDETDFSIKSTHLFLLC